MSTSIITGQKQCEVLAGGEARIVCEFTIFKKARISSKNMV